MSSKTFFVWVSGCTALIILACTPTADPQGLAKSPPTTESAQVVQGMPDIEEIAPDAEIKEGHIVFQGMVRPTKGGYDVRGVIIEDDGLPKALAKVDGADTKTPEWFLGAIVRITGFVRKHEASPAMEDGVVMQMRAGTFFELDSIEKVIVVENAEMIEGTLERSKGFFALGGHLVTREDVSWSLGPQGGREGDRVRFFGQSRTVHCEPNAQCLIQGSLPLFDVGRAERLQ